MTEQMSSANIPHGLVTRNVVLLRACTLLGSLSNPFHDIIISENIWKDTSSFDQETYGKHGYWFCSSRVSF